MDVGRVFEICILVVHLRFLRISCRLLREFWIMSSVTP